MTIEVAVLEDEGPFILLEDVSVDVRDKCLCIHCDKKLTYVTQGGKDYFQHFHGPSKACYPKSNYHRVLKQCQTRNDWELEVQCATPACNQNVLGTYIVSAECVSKIIIRALRTKQYCLKAGTDEFSIRPLYCTSCARTPASDARTVHGLDTRMTVARIRADHATRTRLESENQKKDVIEQLQRIQKQLKDKSESLKKATLMEKEALAFIARVWEQDEAERAERDREQQRVDAHAKATRDREQQRVEAEATATREREQQRVDAEAKATREREQQRVDAHAKATRDREQQRVEAEATVTREREQQRVDAEATATREREQQRVEAEAKATRERDRQRVDAEAKATREREQQRVDAEAKATRERDRQRVDAEAKATRERDRQRVDAEAAFARDRQRVETEAAFARDRQRADAEAAAATQAIRVVSNPYTIADTLHQNVAVELRTVSAVTEYVNSLQFNRPIFGTTAQVWLTQGAAFDLPPKLSLPRMTTTHGVYSAGFFTSPNASMNLDLNIKNSLLEVLILLLDKRLVDFVLSNCATFFGSELSADSVKAKFRPLIKSLNWTKCCRVKIDPNQQVRRLISNGELSTHATVQDISPGDNVEVTVNIVPYFNREYFGNGLKCTDVVLTTKQPKLGVSGVPLIRAHVIQAENAAARERERVVEAANAAAQERERERERAVEAENAAATRKQERNKARRLRVEIEYAEQLARLQAEKEKAEAAIENSDTDE